MSIYTRKGDAGQTSLADGRRVSKLHSRIEAVGTVDELSSALGLARGLVQDEAIGAALREIQAKLLKVNSAISSPKYATAVSPEWAKELERAIDAADAELPPQTDWVLPGDTAGSGALHLARSVARRAERAVLRVYAGGDTEGAEEPVAPEGQVILTFLNRLSDYLHIAGRLEAHRQLVRGIARRVAATMADSHGTPGALQPPDAALTLADCDRMLAAAEAKAREIGVPMVMAVVDDGGNLKAFRRMDGSLLVSVQLAVGKAYTSAALRQPSQDVGALAQPGAVLYGIGLAEPGRIVTFGGGLPLSRGGRIIGGIGVSGGTVEQDEEVARAGQQALEQAPAGSGA